VLFVAVLITTNSLTNSLETTKAELRHRVTLDQMSDGVITMDKRGLIAALNPAAELLFGYGPGEAIGREAAILMPEKYREAHEKGLQRYFSGKGAKIIGKGAVELEGLKKSGEVFAISLSLNEFIADGEKLVTSIVKDITGEKRLKLETERAAAELTQLIDTANAPIFGIDATSRVTEWNQTAVRISGFEKEEVLGRDLVQDFITEEYKDSVKEVFDKALRGEETANFEFPLYTKDGKRLDVLLNASTRRDLEGNIVGVIGVGQDITAENLARKESEQRSGELTQLIDTANAPIFGIDAVGRVTEWNQTTARISGFEKEEVLGRDLVQDFITEEYKDSVKEVLEKALRGEETANFEFPLYSKDGKRLDVLLNASTRRDLEGNIVGVIGVGQDVSLLKEKENALQQSQKMEAVGQLTGGLAHDFNNLLSIIQGNLRFLQEDLGKVDGDITLLFDDALSAVDDGIELTGRLLRFSSNRNLRPMVQEVNEAMEKFYRLMSRTIGEKVSLALSLPEERLFVSVDPSQLENALINLVINARDAMPNGGEISVMAEKIDYTEAKRSAKQSGMNELPLQDFIKISVRDQGEGIKPSILDRVTEPFFTTKDVGSGTGLGLSMVYSFMKTSGGFLRINSEVGEGTVVEMYFPSMSEEKESSAEEVAVSRKSKRY
jgi:PAS domain S-box-containing protein